MKSSDEMMESLLSRREEYEISRLKSRRRLQRIAVISACAALVVVGSAAAIRAGLTKEEPAARPPEALKGPDSGAPTAAGTRNGTLTYAPVVIGTQDGGEDVPGSDEEGGNAPAETAIFTPGGENGEGDVSEPSDDVGTQYFNIPVLPATNGIDFVGEEITEAEAKAYFAENLPSIVSSLAASGVETDGLRISERGAVHIRYNGAEGEKLTADLGWRDYYAYSGDTLVAVVTLTKENAKLYSSLSFGAPSFEKLGAFFSDHAGEKLIFVYAGACEIILAPDGTALTFDGTDLSTFFGGLDDPYAWFFDDRAAFIA